MTEDRAALPRQSVRVCRGCGASGDRLTQKAHSTICKRADVVPAEEAATEPQVKLVAVLLCEYCLAGAGGECHVPGCALWMNRAPDVPVQIVADLKVEMADV